MYNTVSCTTRPKHGRRVVEAAEAVEVAEARDGGGDGNRGRGGGGDKDGEGERHSLYVDELHGSIPVRRVSRAWTDMTQLVSSACRTWIGDRAHGPARLARLVSMDIM